MEEPPYVVRSPILLSQHPLSHIPAPSCTCSLPSPAQLLTHLQPCHYGINCFPSQPWTNICVPRLSLLGPHHLPTLAGSRGIVWARGAGLGGDTLGWGHTASDGHTKQRRDPSPSPQAMPRAQRRHPGHQDGSHQPGCPQGWAEVWRRLFQTPPAAAQPHPATADKHFPTQGSADGMEGLLLTVPCQPPCPPSGDMSQLTRSCPAPHPAGICPGRSVLPVALLLPGSITLLGIRSCPASSLLQPPLLPSCSCIPDQSLAME